MYLRSKTRTRYFWRTFLLHMVTRHIKSRLETPAKQYSKILQDLPATFFQKKNSAKLRDDMKLADYLKFIGEKNFEFSIRAKIPERTIYNILAGKTPNLKTAVVIEKVTKGKVKCKDLLAEEKASKEKKMDNAVKPIKRLKKRLREKF